MGFGRRTENYQKTFLGWPDPILCFPMTNSPFLAFYTVLFAKVDNPHVLCHESTQDMSEPTFCFEEN